MAAKLIIGYQPTPAGDDALALGGMMAKVLAATPVLATVFPWPRGLMSDADLEIALERSTASPLATARDRLGLPEVETRAIADRSPARALHNLAERERAALLIVGSAHRGSVGRVLLGSTGESLLHGAPCGIAVAPRGFAESQPESLQRVGVAFDGSAESWSALETGIGIAGRTHGSLTIVTVAELPTYGLATSYSILVEGDLHDAEREEKQRIMDLARARVPGGIPVEARLATGDPGPVLAQVGEEFDLLICGSRGYGPLRRTLIGSATTRLARSAPCPVMILPRGSGTDPLGLGNDRVAAAATANADSTD